MGDPNFVPKQINAETLKEIISKGFSEGSVVEVIDVTGDAYHFEVKVFSADFEGLNTLKQHQKVYALVGDEFKDKLHAMTLKTGMPVS